MQYSETIADVMGDVGSKHILRNIWIAWKEALKC